MPLPRARGLTLTELAVALLLLGGVAAVAVPWRFGSRRDAAAAGAAAALRAAAKAETVYRASGQGRYCQDLPALARSVPGVPGIPPRGLLAGYRFGGIGLDENGAAVDPARRFAYYAVPGVYGVAGRLTLIVDAEGQVYARDTGSGMPPASWPASDPMSAGWTLLGP